MQAVAFRITDLVAQVAFLLVAEAFAVSDQQFEITCVRLVDGWVVRVR